TLHGAPAPPSTSAHDVEAEAGVVARWVGHALDHRALPAGSRVRAGEELDRVRAMLAGPRPGPAALVHRDLHDKQVLVAPAGDVGVLDLDTLAWGETALDVANLLVHLELRALQGGCPLSRAEVAAAAFLDGYRPAPAVTARLGAFAASTRLRLACVYAFRPTWAGVVSALLERPQVPLAV
ncbi:MAG: phosphotransferase, partial [Actinomycetota bacterium]|nr:phosphotransferase [Actinomycetota bacterium]